MSNDIPPIPPERDPPQPKVMPNRKNMLTAGIVAVCIAIIGYAVYALMMKSRSQSPDEVAKQQQVHVLQLDVLNGCGAKGAAAKVTTMLRSSGFDVVEVKNYKTFGVPHTLVLDRIGDLNAAKRVARALGVSENNIIQQINPDYFVNVSVIIGADYSSLKAAM